MSDGDRREEPTTVPPPSGAKDAYSAPTRVGTLPEDVLAAMRQHDDQTLAARTRSGTQRAARVSAPPPLPGSTPAGPSLPRPSTPPRAMPSSRPFAPLTLPPPPPDEALSELWSNPPVPLELPAPGPWQEHDLSEDVLFEPERRFVLLRSLLVVVLFAVLGGALAIVILFG
ncbi:MAG: hypothetical protein BGO98_06120 [Myxococcales bacterium 68-20]|nr:hypothetical protein [Myxococcales bacterium]OJY26597.1 MAG: hypothetical protein BGO98_06120 [Myxococcales bacterium 68-20]